MNIIKQSIRDFYPPDFVVSGEGVRRARAGDAVAGAAPLLMHAFEGQNSSMELERQRLRAILHPDRARPELNHVILEGLSRTIEMFENYLESLRIERFNVENYTIEISVHESDGVMAVAFIPNVHEEVVGVPFEVPRRGVWVNGPGVVFYLSMADFSLLHRDLMR